MTDKLAYKDLVEIIVEYVDIDGGGTISTSSHINKEKDVYTEVDESLSNFDIKQNNDPNIPDSIESHQKELLSSAIVYASQKSESLNDSYRHRGTVFIQREAFFKKLEEYLKKPASEIELINIATQINDDVLKAKRGEEIIKDGTPLDELAKDQVAKILKTQEQVNQLGKGSTFGDVILALNYDTANTNPLNLPDFKEKVKDKIPTN